MYHSRPLASNQESLTLIRAEFESSGDFSGAQVTSIPAGAFVTASWSFQDRVLTLWLGSDVPADEQVMHTISQNVVSGADLSATHV
jgi:hypothetical protein